jgi:hypothetical protein
MKLLGRSVSVVACACALAAFNCLADVSAPVLNITKGGTNQVSVTVNSGSGFYQLYYKPSLGSTNTWTLCTNGLGGQTNFVLSTAGQPSGFYMGVNNTGAPPFSLGISIQSPASGANIQ